MIEAHRDYPVAEEHAPAPSPRPLLQRWPGRSGPSTAGAFLCPLRLSTGAAGRRVQSIHNLPKHLAGRTCRSGTTNASAHSAGELPVKTGA